MTQWIHILAYCALFAIISALWWNQRKCKCHSKESFATKETVDDSVDDVKTVVASKIKASTKLDEEDSEDDADLGKEAEKVEVAPINKIKQLVQKIKMPTLNKEEMKLFEGLRENMFSEQDIKSLVREGKLNEMLIEKFLQKVEAMESGGAARPSPSANKGASAPKSAIAKEEDTLEGFDGRKFASALFR